MQGLRSSSAHLCPPPPREGRGEVANSDFVTFASDPRECMGYVVFQPICGPRRRQG